VVVAAAVGLAEASEVFVHAAHVDNLNPIVNGEVNVTSLVKFTHGNTMWVDHIWPYSRPEVYNYVRIANGLDLTGTYVTNVHEITSVKNHDVCNSEGPVNNWYCYFDQFLNSDTRVYAVAVVGTCGEFILNFWTYGLLYVFNESQIARWIPIVTQGCNVTSPYDGTANYGRLKFTNHCGYTADFVYLASVAIAKPTYVMDGYCDDIPDYGVFDCAPVNPDEWRKRRETEDVASASGKPGAKSTRAERLARQEAKAPAEIKKGIADMNKMRVGKKAAEAAEAARQAAADAKANEAATRLSAQF